VSRLLVISFSDLGRDSRLDRQLGFLAGRHDVVAAGLGRPAREDVAFVDLTPPAEGRGRALGRRAAGLARLAARRSEAVYWRHATNRTAFERLRDVPFDLVLANDVPALPLAVRLAAGRPVVFDAHEYAPAELEHLRWWRLLIAPYVDALLRRNLPHVAAMSTVGPTIADRYAAAYGVPRPVVVTNAPHRADLAPSPVGSPIRMLHHGVADPARQLDLMIDVVDALEGAFTLDLMLVATPSGELERLRARAARSRWTTLVEPVPMSEIVARANAYDIGLYLLPPRHLNQQLALPNKLFEFIQARLAVAIGPSPEMAAIVREHGCGVMADDFTPAALAAALRALEPGDVERLKYRSDAAAAVLCAERNRELVLELVERALSPAAA
jgi:hypothetical protein